MPGTPRAGVGELVGGARRGDDYLAAGRLDGVPSHGEAEVSFLNDENLGVGVGVQARAFAGWRLRDEERHLRPTVEVSLEAVGAAAVRKLVFVDHEVGHALLLRVCDRRDWGRGPGDRFADRDWAAGKPRGDPSPLSADRGHHSRGAGL